MLTDQSAPYGSGPMTMPSLQQSSQSQVTVLPEYESYESERICGSLRKTIGAPAGPLYAGTPVVVRLIVTAPPPLPGRSRRTSR